MSLSALAYGGYRLAARLVQSLGKPVVAEFDQRAETLRKGIESYFGAKGPYPDEGAIDMLCQGPFSVLPNPLTPV